jgi:ABC-type sugar transport system ATPase subunit
MMVETTPQAARLFLQARGLTKAYPGTLALDQVSFEVGVGEVRGLVGENGAGKSTLVKILSGATQPTSGQLVVGGEAGPLGSPRAAIEAGIATIHQQLTVVPQFTVAENITLGRERSLSWLRGTRSRRRGRAVAQVALDRVGARLDPDRRVSELAYSERQLVDIAKALSTDCALLILDEPTAALSRDDSRNLLALLRRLADEGHSVVYVSHRLDEVLALTDRVTVLRDGRHIATQETSSVSKDDLIELMVGGVTEMLTTHPASERSLLEVSAAGVPPYFDDVTFDVRAGEILGLAGVLGSGRTELLEALAGARALGHGELRVDGRRVRSRSTQRALQHRIAHLPADRQAKGLALGMSARCNIVLPPGGAAARWGCRHRSRERELTRELMLKTQVRPLASELRVEAFSGGNQQKALIARLIYTNPKIVLLNEPTQGVDVAGRAQIHDLLREMAANGIAVVISSSDVEELQALCHRILAMRAGRLSGELAAEKSTPEEVLRLILPTSSFDADAASGTTPKYEKRR